MFPAVKKIIPVKWADSVHRSFYHTFQLSNINIHLTISEFLKKLQINFFRWLYIISFWITSFVFPTSWLSTQIKDASLYSPFSLTKNIVAVKASVMIGIPFTKNIILSLTYNWCIVFTWNKRKSSLTQFCITSA